MFVSIYSSIWRKIAWIAPKFACRLSFTQGSDKFEKQFGRTSTFKMAADLNKNGVCHFFQNAVTPEIMVGIAPYLVHRGTLGAPSTFLVLALVWRHVTFLWPYPFYKLFCVSAPLAPKLLGLEWSNLGEIVNKDLYSRFVLFLTLPALWPWHSANLRNPFRIFLAYDRIVPKSTILLPFDEG